VFLARVDLLMADEWGVLVFSEIKKSLLFLIVGFFLNMFQPICIIFIVKKQQQQPSTIIKKKIYYLILTTKFGRSNTICKFIFENYVTNINIKI